jgi:1-acyl-sn-glycerol-3-phosphate acyltransferase
VKGSQVNVGGSVSARNTNGGRFARIFVSASSELAKAWLEISDTAGIKGTGRNIAKPWFYSFLRWSAQPLMRLMRMRWIGLNHLPKRGPAIFAGNHLSHVDPLFIITGGRRFTYYLTKDDHFKRRHTAWFMRSTGQIETARETGASDALATAIDILNSGHALGIFPEGTRSRRTEAPFILKGKTGVARIAASLPKVPVFPVGHHGTREIMAPKIGKFPKLWRGAEFNFGKGITWLEWLNSPHGGNHTPESLATVAAGSEAEIRAEHAHLCRKFTDQLMQSLIALGAP